MAFVLTVLLLAAAPAFAKLDLRRQGESEDPVKRIRAALLSVHTLVDRERPGMRELLPGGRTGPSGPHCYDTTLG